MLATICGAAFFERTFWLTKRRFSLVRGWSWHARLPRSRPQHPSCGSQEKNVLNTAHLLMWSWRHAQPNTRRGNLDRKRWQFKSMYGVLYGDIRHLIVTLVGCTFSGYGLQYWSRRDRSNRTGSTSPATHCRSGGIFCLYTAVWSLQSSPVQSMDGANSQFNPESSVQLLKVPTRLFCNLKAVKKVSRRKSRKSYSNAK